MTLELATRRRVGLLIRIGLIVGTIVFVLSWMGGRVARGAKNIRVQPDAPSAATLGPGDLQILSMDGSIDITLQGNRILAGLSPATVGKMRAEMQKETRDSGLGGVIAGVVKSSVASAIGTHFSWPLSDVAELTYDGRQLVLRTRKGDTHRLFGDVKTDGNKEPASFSREDAERFIAAVQKRKAELGIP